MVPGSPGGCTGPQTSQAPHRHPPSPDTIDLRELIAVLRRHARLLFACTLGAVAGAAVLVIFQRPEYRATATIRLKNERQVLTGTIETPGLDQMLGKTVDPLLSQLEVMRSRTVAGEVVRRTGLRLVPLDDNLSYGSMSAVSVSDAGATDTLEFRFGDTGFTVRGQRVPMRRASYGQRVEVAGAALTISGRPGEGGSARVAVLDEQEVVEHVQDHLRAVTLDKTDVVDVSYTDPDPDRARAVANTAVAVFREANANEAQQLSRRRRVFVEEQLAKTDSVLAIAQAALSEFRRREEVFSTREKFAAQQTGMMDLQLRREELGAQRRVHARMLEALRSSESASALGAFIGAPGVSGNLVIASLYQQLERYQAARDSLTAGRWASAPTNPDVQRLDALIASARAGLLDAASGQLAAIDARLTALGELENRSAAGLQVQPDKEAEEMRLVQRVETASRLADQLREEWQKAQIAEAIEVGQVEVIDMAPLPRQPIGTGTPLKLSLAMMLGLIVGSGAAFMREHLNTKIARKDEMEALLGVSGLAVIPRFTMPKNGNGIPPLRLPVRAQPIHVERPRESLVTVRDERSAGAEAFRSLRTNLLFSHSIQQLRSVMITSAMAGEGKTTTSANVAVAFAQQGLRVLLVDCDLRKARLHHVFGMTRNPGLTDVIAGAASVADIVRPTGISGLSLVASGTLPPNPAEMLGSAPMVELIDRLKSQADLMIVDAAPVLVAGDTSILGRMVDGTVIVVRAGRTESAAAHAAVQQLRTVGVRVVGGVLNDPDGKVPSYQGYAYYAYGSSDGPES